MTVILKEEDPGADSSKPDEAQASGNHADKRIVALLVAITDLDGIEELHIIKHIPEIPGYNAGVEFDDGSGISVAGDSLLEALENLADEWRVKYRLSQQLPQTKANTDVQKNAKG